MNGTEIDVQIRIGRHQDNRGFRLEWFGDSCGGAIERQLEGVYSAATQYPIRVRVFPGICEFRAIVFKQGRKSRGIAKLRFEVAGGK
jgi:hypothetical protein